MSGMSLQTLMPFIIKVTKFYLPSTLAVLVPVGVVLFLVRLFGWLNIGNLPKYNPKNTPKSNALSGKNIIFLGSSVTKGMAAYGNSFADMVAESNGAAYVKEAVSGTTLVEQGKRNYITRLKAIDKNTPCDVFVCQLSTNDATKKKPLGTITDSKDIASFDTKTVCGAIEYVIAYAKQTWNCPVVFYTSPAYASPAYMAMVDALKNIAAKWDIDVIDLWGDAEINAKRNKKRSFMNDQIHPTKKGYQLWAPIVEKSLADVLEGKKLSWGNAAPTAVDVKKAKTVKTIKKVLVALLCVLVFVVAGAVMILSSFIGALSFPTTGNDAVEFGINTVAPVENSPLSGKTILSIGSSVTVGQGDVNFDRALEAADGCTVISVAEGATTIAIREGLDSSYVERLDRSVQDDWDIDAVIIQISSNDASAGNGVGTLTDGFSGDASAYDRTTTLGGLEYLIGYCTEKWGCPVLIYSTFPFESGPLYDAEAYKSILAAVQSAVDKWSEYTNVVFVDNFNNPEIQNLSEEQLYRWQVDPVHPSRAGYIEWWLPSFESALYPFFE